ncbi:MAG TPA: ABC transporter ATP-binding protein [Thiothrix sp.]|nr:ABC transporter ATP-binding protein [Thiothrix sp.]
MSYALKISNLFKTYPNGLTALNNIHLQVEKGDFFALLGANGAGKSTTLGIICSLVNKTSGSVQVFDHDLDQARFQVKNYIGLVPQEFNFNIFEPVEEILVNQAGYYGIQRMDAFKRSKVLLQRLDLWDKRHEIARNLSGGMKRRLMIGRALMHQPQLLILDEPTAGVDIEIRRSMWDFLQTINQEGTTIILTTHYLEEAENLCRNIAILDQGELLIQTSMKSLLNRLQMETLLLDLKSPLNHLPNIDKQHDYKLSLIDSHTLSLSYNKSSTLNEIFDFLNQQSIEVVSLRNKSNRLEELFIRLLQENKKSTKVQA